MNPSDTTNPSETISSDEEAALEFVRELRGFYTNVTTYLVMICFLFIINYITNPGYIWAWWVVLGWGLGIAGHAVAIFQEASLFGPGWEKRQVEKRLGRKL